MKLLAPLALCLGAMLVLPWDMGIIPGPIPRNTTRTAADEPQETAAYSRRVLTFPCSGVKCQAWLYVPKHSKEKPPVIVAAHGVGCQKDMALAHYGDRFAKAGFATFIFDYRTFGGSEGEPRQWASPSRHLDDFVSAVQYIKAELGDVVDVNRVNLWGTSFSGGHVLTLAGSRLRDDITSVVAQVPFTDGTAFLLDNLKRRPLVVVRAIMAGLHDALRGLVHYPPAYVPLTGERGSFSLLDITPEDSRAFYGTHPPVRQGGWRNAVRAIIALESLYRPIRHIPNIRAPLLYLAATNDTLIPLESVTKAVRATPDGQLYTVKSSHFGVYSGVPFPYLVQHTIAFLREKNGMKRLILSSAEAAGMGRPQPAMAHKGPDPGAAAPVDDIRAEREEIVETAAEL